MLASFLSFSGQAFAFNQFHFFKAPRILQQVLHQELEQMKELLDEEEMQNEQAQNRNFVIADSNNKTTALYLQRIRMMVYPYIKFDVLFFELKIAPMIEFRWTRKVPKGWKYYNPY